MLTINNACYARQISNSQNNKPQNTPKPQILTKDTISFKAHEKLFLKELDKVCEMGWDSHTGGQLQVIARGVDPNHPDVVKRLKQIKANSSIEQRVQYFVNEELPEFLGKGELKYL